MSFPVLLQLLAGAPNAVPGGPLGPSAPPSNLTRYYYSGVRIGLEWTNGDATAYTRIYWNGAYLKQKDPGISSDETAKTSGLFGISHYKNGQETEIVSETP